MNDINISYKFGVTESGETLPTSAVGQTSLSGVGGTGLAIQPPSSTALVAQPVFEQITAHCPPMPMTSLKLHSVTAMPASDQNADPLAVHAMTLAELQACQIKNLKINKIFNALAISTVGFTLSTEQSCSQSRCEAQKFPEKNRYHNILPFDNNRVMVGGARYINASIINIPGLAPGTAIATQGPTSNTIEDFFEMVEERKGVIVALTNDIELGKEKCENYWSSRTISEDCLEKVHSQELIKRELTHNGKTLTMYHYQNWPDHGSPEPKVIKTLLEAIEDPELCTIVHCSAGVGRTGTYLAIKALCQEIKGQRNALIPDTQIKINVPAIVRQMRFQRACMVTSKDQLGAIFECIHYYFETDLRKSD